MKLIELRRLRIQTSELFAKTYSLWEQEQDEETKEFLRKTYMFLDEKTKDLYRLENQNFIARKSFKGEIKAWKE